LISGDQDLLALKRVGPIVIIAPAEFWKWERERK
jgi:predicted nucleic acid-binding protein